MKNAEYIKTKAIQWLLEGNLSFDASQDAIGAEVLFSSNKRMADLLVLSNELHALEIKGDFDKLGRLQGQLEDYHRTFDKVSVVTTLKHLFEIRNIIRPATGLILFDNDAFKVLRIARLQKRLDKSCLLMFLRKNELTNLFRIKNSESLSITEIRSRVAENLTITEIRNAAYSALRKRYRELFRLFLHDTSKHILVDDLRSLSGRIEELRI